MSGVPAMGVLRGAEVVRHFGDPAGEWQAATTGAALRDRSHRRRWTVTGRQPEAMLKGLVTGRIPERDGRAEYSVVLTPKGRIVGDLRLWRVDDGFGLDIATAGADPLRAHFTRFLPPRFAQVDDTSEVTAMLAVFGPTAAEPLAALLGGDPGGWRAMAEGDLRVADGEVRCIRSGDIAEDAWDLVGPREAIAGLRAALEAAGVRPVGSGVWEALRLEAGRPAFGAELTEAVIPTEAGIDARAIDATKGCYTGQEVIVRIRDRGHVNRHLRRLRLGDGPLPAAGAELWRENGERVVGHLTTVGTSPREGALALGYVRREVVPPGPVRLGDAEGRLVTIEALDG